MDERRKKPLLPWIVATVVALPVLYLASFGPACWLVCHGWFPREPAAWAYWPIWLAILDEGKLVSAVSDYIWWYGMLFSEEGYYLMLNIVE